MIEEVIEGDLVLHLLEPTLTELAHVLVEKLDYDREHLAGVLAFLRDLADAIEPSPERPPDEVTGDQADDLILACAVPAGVGVLVSGDRRHLLPVGEHRGVRILAPQALLAELRESRSSDSGPR